MLYFSACSNDFLSRLLPFTRRWRTPLGFRWQTKLQELPYQVGQILTQESQLFNKIQTILQALLVLNNSPAIACESQFLKWKSWSPYTPHQLHMQSLMFSRNPKHQSISYSNLYHCLWSHQIQRLLHSCKNLQKEIYIRSVALPVIPSLSTPCWTDWHVIGLGIEIGIHWFVNVGWWGKHHMDMGNSQVAEWLMKCHSYWRPGINSWRSWN